jgi:hypothetical protein
LGDFEARFGLVGERQQQRTSVALALPVAGSSHVPESGENMRARMRLPSRA